MPFPEKRFEPIIEDSAAHLQQQVGTFRRPAHRLALSHALIHQVAHSRFCGRAGYSQPMAVGMSVVGQAVLVVGEVFAQSQEMLAKSLHAINIHGPLGAYGSICSIGRNRMLMWNQLRMLNAGFWVAESTRFFNPSAPSARTERVNDFGTTGFMSLESNRW